MLAAPSPASSSGLRSANVPASLPVMTVPAYGADMMSTLRERSDRSQSAFGTDLLEALEACAELINTGRSADGDGLRDVADVQAFGDRYGFHGNPAGPRDAPRLRGHRARLDAIAVALRGGRRRGRHRHAERAARPDRGGPADRRARWPWTAHPRVPASRTDGGPDRRAPRHGPRRARGLRREPAGARCASPTCRDVFVDLSRNRSRRYCDSRTCGNRLHVAAYRARRSQAG